MKKTPRQKWFDEQFGKYTDKEEIKLSKEKFVLTKRLAEIEKRMNEILKIRSAHTVVNYTITAIEKGHIKCKQ